MHYVPKIVSFGYDEKQCTGGSIRGPLVPCGGPSSAGGGRPSSAAGAGGLAVGEAVAGGSPSADLRHSDVW